MGVGGDIVEDAQAVSVHAAVTIDRAINDFRAFTDDLLMRGLALLISGYVAPAL